VDNDADSRELSQAEKRWMAGQAEKLRQSSVAGDERLAPEVQKLPGF
jgi:hypothetical protein